jgi:hypothetical protein
MEPNKCGLADRTVEECNPPVQYPRTDNRCGICGVELHERVSREEMERYLWDVQTLREKGE